MHRAFTASHRQTGAARPAARPARPARSRGADLSADPATGAGGGRSRSARRRPGARLPARAVRRAGSGVRCGLCRGAARPSLGGRPRRLDRGAGRSVRAGAECPGPAARAPDRGADRCARRPSLGARGGAAQPGPGSCPGRGRSPDPDPEPPAAAGRRGQGGDRVPVAPDGGVRGPQCCPDRSYDPVADRGTARPHGFTLGAAALAGRAVALPRRPHRRLGDRVARRRVP